MSKFTSGPWVVSDQIGSKGCIKAKTGFVASVFCNPWKVNETKKEGESWLDMSSRTEKDRDNLALEVDRSFL